MTQPCNACGRALPADAFYKSCPTRCKECTRAAARAYRVANIERVREYDRKRGLEPDRKAAVRARAHLYVGKYEPDVESAARKARIKVGNAIAKGKLKPKPCERCSFPFGVHAHHEDYSKPLDVVWLCVKCHGERHREINEERRRRAC